MLNNMQQQQARQAEQMAELQRQRQPETTPRQLTVEELADMVNEGEVSEEEAIKVSKVSRRK